jgi:hypothetical protein
VDSGRGPIAQPKGRVLSENRRVDSGSPCSLWRNLLNSMSFFGKVVAGAGFANFRRRRALRRMVEP